MGRGDMNSRTRCQINRYIFEEFPSFGIPEKISSDNGPAFVHSLMETITKALRIKRRLGCVYHPIAGNGRKSKWHLESKNSENMCRQEAQLGGSFATSTNEHKNID